MANRRLFEVATNLGDSVTRDMGKHWSVPTVKGMFAHIYGRIRCGSSAGRAGRRPGCPATRTSRRWSTFARSGNAFEAEQRAFVDGLGEADLARPVTYQNTQGAQFTVPLGPCSSTWPTTPRTTAASLRP